jgi:hypothetical protein
MPKMSIVVPHSLTQEEALTRVQRLLGDMKQQYGDQISELNETWSGNRGEFSFKAMGFATSGTLAVTPSQLELDGSLPFAAMPFKSKIESTIRERAQKLLA